MADLLKHVQAGDVITHQMWNEAVDAINGLLQAGQTSGIQISTLLPAGTNVDPILVGTIQQISGQSFGYSIGLTTVTFEGPSGNAVVNRSDMLPGSSDTRLLFTVPTIPGLSQTGNTVPMRVSNGVAQDVRSVFVRPVVFTVQGDIFINWDNTVATNPNPNPLVGGQQADFRFTLETGTNMPALFTLVADILNATTSIPAGLASTIQFSLPNEPTNPITKLAMGTNESRDILVRIPEIPDSFAAESFTLEIRAFAGNVEGSNARSFTVGQPVTPLDPNIDADLTGFEVFDAQSGNSDPSGGNLSGSTITLQTGRMMVLFYSVTLAAEGAYDLTIEEAVGSTLTGWTLDVLTPDSPINVPVADVPSSKIVNFSITRTSGASAGGMVVLRIKNQGEATDWHQEFQLVPMA